jgi:streptogramin lyase
MPAVAATPAVITEFDVGTGVFPSEITAGSGPNAALWFSDFSPPTGGIGRITTSGGITEFTQGLAAHVLVSGITLGPDGNVWFASGNSDISPTPAVGFITPAGAITTFLLPNTASKLGGIATGSDGNLWFTDFGRHMIGRISPSTHVITEFGGLGPNSSLGGITLGPDGNMWFVDSSLPGLGQITMAGAVTEFSLPPGNLPEAVVAGPDGNLWFTNLGTLGCTDCGPGVPPGIGRFNPKTAAVTQFNTSTSFGPDEITLGPDGNFWFTSLGAANKATGAIGRITPQGAITEYQTGLNAGSVPAGIATGPDGNIWFVDLGCDFCSPIAPRAIGRLKIPTDELGVLVEGTGSVKSSPAGINCGANDGCVFNFDDDSIVTLTATPAPGFMFSGWIGLGASVANCSNVPVCHFPLFNNNDDAITATFTVFTPPPPPPPPPAFNLLVMDLTGSGIVTGTGGISCATSCQANLATGTVVTLTAAPATGFTFSGWSGGGCTGTGSCVVTMNAPATVSATFVFGTRTTESLAVTTTGPTTGTVTSAPAGIACGATCSASYVSGTSVTLTAAPATGYTFSGWSGGGCSGTSTCTVVMNAATSVNASFVQNAPVTASLSVTTTGPTTGTVTSSPAGIACGATCSASFATGTSITLTATPATGFIFSGWTGGGCSGTNNCVVSLSAATSVNAAFVQSAPATASLSVTTTGSTTGTVTSTPAGIACGATCSASFAIGTSVTLTAAPATGFSFAGWSGDGCSGVGACVVTVDAATNIVAAFLANTAPTETLSLDITGSGTVKSAPAGIACSASCSASFTTGSAVTLTATPAAGFSFAGWTGGNCVGIGTCIVTMNAATTVTAGFTAIAQSDIILVSAILPSSRSVQVGGTATVFGTMINASPDTAATLCSVQPATSIPAGFSFQTADSATNQVTGAPNTPVTIPPGGSQSFILALSPTAVIPPTQVAFRFACANAPAAASIPGLNTLLFSASTVQAPDVVALSVTSTGDGIVDIPSIDGTGAFAVATFNIGAPSQINASANTGAAELPVVLSICQTVPATGQCMAPPAPSVATAMATNDAATFAVFVQGSGTVPFQPAVNRVFIQFQDASNTVWGSTSVAVRTQ